MVYHPLEQDPNWRTHSPIPPYPTVQEETSFVQVKDPTNETKLLPSGPSGKNQLLASNTNGPIQVALMIERKKKKITTFNFFMMLCMLRENTDKSLHVYNLRKIRQFCQEHQSLLIPT